MALKQQTVAAMHASDFDKVSALGAEMKRLQMTEAKVAEQQAMSEEQTAVSEARAQAAVKANTKQLITDLGDKGPLGRAARLLMR